MRGNVLSRRALTAAAFFSSACAVSHAKNDLYAQLVCPVQTDKWNPLEHLGANGPWSPGPNVFHISPNAPEGCKVDQAIYLTRHGSRYPDPGAHREWLAFYNKTQSANFTAEGPLSFLKDWQPVLDYPELQLAQLSPGGYEELNTFGAELRTRYPGWYKPNDPFRVWSNDYQRTVDSARLFARGYMGPNATAFGSVYPINASDPSAIANSLATSDSCPTYNDQSGSAQTRVWDSIYLPPIQERLQVFIQGDLNLTTSEVAMFAYLCGFESQITRRESPFCGILTPKEILQYEYRQDLRYYYGTGPGGYNNASVQLPVIQGIVDLLASGPETATIEPDGTSGVIGPLVVAFTHDNQINQMLSRLGIFDSQPPLAPDSLNTSRIYVSSRNNPMRGTITFERLNCSGSLNLRILLNDAVYPVVACQSGPGKSCPLDEYNSQVLAKKWEEAGSFASFCELDSETPNLAANFFTNLTLPAIRKVAP